MVLLTHLSGECKSPTVSPPGKPSSTVTISKQWGSTGWERNESRTNCHDFRDFVQLVLELVNSLVFVSQKINTNVIIWSFSKYNFQYLQWKNKMHSICLGILYCPVSSFTGRHCWQIYYFVLEPADFCILTEINRTHDMLFYRCWWSRPSQGRRAFLMAWGPVDPFHYIIQCSIFASLRLQLKKEECEETGEKKA